MMRSMLFVPGNNPGMLLNADIHGADAIILDLEDAVSPGEKDAARVLVRRAVQALAYRTKALIIRVNPLGTAYLAPDLDEIVPLRPMFVMPTKVSSTDDVLAISEMIRLREERANLPLGSIGLIPLLETASGIENAGAIAACDPRVKGLFLGAEDLTSDLRATRSKESGEIAYARSRVVIAARAAGIDAYDTPFTDVNDDEGLQNDAAYARSIGFSGKAAISPRHIDGINRAFSPTEAEVSYANEVLFAIEEGARLGRGAVSLRGKMIDKPIVDRAKTILAMADALKEARV